MSKTNYRAKMADTILDSPKGTIIFGVITVLFGLLFGFVLTGNTEPVSRNDALVYEGEFEKYREGKNSSTICFVDGSEQELYPHTLKEEVVERLESLPQGTKLYLLINPNTYYVAELRTENEEILNFEATQKEIDDYQIGYTIIGIVVACGGVFLIVYGCVMGKHEKKKAEKKIVKDVARKTPLRQAAEGKARILLKAQKGKYNICYRRVGCVNELVINGEVWDEYKARIEFEHCLSAVVDGNKIEAGYSDDSYSYIAFNGHWIKEKKRWI